MVHRHPLQRLLFVLPMFLAACATTGWQGARARVDDLTARVEQVRLEAEVTRARTADALAQLRTLTAADQGSKDVVKVYAQLVQSIDATEQQARALRDAVGPMKAAATRVFEQWERDVAGIASEDLRQRGQTRLQRSKERFAAIVLAADAAETTLATFHRALRDHTLFLDHDLNPESLREIQAEVVIVAATQKAADTQLDGCMKSAHTYLSGAALPGGTPGDAPAAPPAAPGGSGK